MAAYLLPNAIQKRVRFRVKGFRTAIDRIQKHDQVIYLLAAELRGNRAIPQSVLVEDCPKGSGLATMQIRGRIADPQQGRHIKAEGSQGQLAAKWGLSADLEAIVGVKRVNVFQELQDVRVVDTIINRGVQGKAADLGSSVYHSGINGHPALARVFVKGRVVAVNYLTLGPFRPPVAGSTVEQTKGSRSRPFFSVAIPGAPTSPPKPCDVVGRGNEGQKETP